MALRMALLQRGFAKINQKKPYLSLFKRCGIIMLWSR